MSLASWSALIADIRASSRRHAVEAERHQMGALLAADCADALEVALRILAEFPPQHPPQCAVPRGGECDCGLTRMLGRLR